jgi:hypothetical protein
MHRHDFLECIFAPKESVGNLYCLFIVEDLDGEEAYRTGI